MQFARLVNKRLVSHRFTVYFVSFYVGLVFGCLAVRDSFLVSHVLVLPILDVYDDYVIDSWYRSYCKEHSIIDEWLRSYRMEHYVIDEWYQSYRRDFVPDASGRIFKESKPVVKRETLFRDLVLVGRGRVTSDKCAEFRGFFGCVRHDPVYIRPYFNSCDKPSCPLCYRAWAQREGYMNIAPRLLAASEVFGLPVEHVVVSLPKSDYDLTFKKAKRRCIEIAFACGVKGGVMIPHGNRIDRVTRVESFSGHFHLLAFLEENYERCRHCKGGDCYACDGVEGRCYRVYGDTGYIVRVLDKRETVGGTAYYQLNHSSTDMLKRRFRVAVWFGRCGYNNLGVKFAKPRLLCKICGSQCGFLDYVGSKPLVIDRESPDFKSEFFESFLQDGQPAWVVKEFVPRGGGEDL